MKVIKRDGRIVEFNKAKIEKAIISAMHEVGLVDYDVLNRVVSSIEKVAETKELSVEEIQDLVETKLMASSAKRVAKAYILYRNDRTAVRENKGTLMTIYEDIVLGANKDILNENANVDGESPMGQMGKIGSESAKVFALEKLIKPHIRDAIKHNYVYPHDADFYPTGTTTCCQIPLGKLLKQGFNTGHGFIRQPSNIMSASSLSAIILQANQNMQHGGQSFAMFDYDLAPYVAKTYAKHESDLWNTFNVLNLHIDFDSDIEKQVEALAWEKTKKDTYQAMEAFVHNMNSMNSRSAGQVPFSTVNVGTDTSREGQLVTEALLLATEAGLGNGETPIFPISIFKVKEGVSYNPEDPNYYLFELAIRVSSKRLFPNFSFLDAPYNLEYYVEGKPETEVAYMGCRTRVLANINGEHQVTGRGNLSFTTLNLVKMALESNGNNIEFFNKLNQYIDIAIEQMLDRYKLQCSKKAKNFKFLMGQGVWIDSETLDSNDTLEEVLKHGTLSLGFIGLAEALVALTGLHHGHLDEINDLGINIVKFMRKKLDEASQIYKLNFTLLATPAEGLSGKFIAKDKKEFGEISGITDKEYYTNSFHIPVYFPIKAIDKIRKEAPYHALCNAGHITYIEVDGNARNNPEAFKAIIMAMKESGIGYGAVNHPVDRCKVCGYEGIIGDSCPVCGVKDDGYNISRIRRITGYLVGTLDRFNNAKKAEEKDRVKHSYEDNKDRT